MSEPDEKPPVRISSRGVLYHAGKALVRTIADINPLSKFVSEFYNSLSEASRDEREARLVDLATRVERLSGPDAAPPQATRDAAYLARAYLEDADARKAWAYAAMIHAFDSNRVDEPWRVVFMRLCRELFHEQLYSLAAGRAESGLADVDQHNLLDLPDSTTVQLLVRYELIEDRDEARMGFRDRMSEECRLFVEILREGAATLTEPEIVEATVERKRTSPREQSRTR